MLLIIFNHNNSNRREKPCKLFYFYFATDKLYDLDFILNLL